MYITLRRLRATRGISTAQLGCIRSTHIVLGKLRGFPPLLYVMLRRLRAGQLKGHVVFNLQTGDLEHCEASLIG